MYIKRMSPCEEATRTQVYSGIHGQDPDIIIGMRKMWDQVSENRDQHWHCLHLTHWDVNLKPRVNVITSLCLWSAPGVRNTAVGNQQEVFKEGLYTVSKSLICCKVAQTWQSYKTGFYGRFYSAQKQFVCLLRWYSNSLHKRDAPSKGSNDPI